MVRRELGDAGVVEEGVHAAEAGRGLGDGLAGGVVADVALNHHRLGAVAADQIRRLLRLGLAGGVVDDHRLGAAPGGLHRDGSAEARGGAGDQHDASVEIPSHASTPVFVTFAHASQPRAACRAPLKP